VTLASLIEKEARSPKNARRLPGVCQPSAAGYEARLRPHTIYAALLEHHYRAHSTGLTCKAIIHTIPIGTRACRRGPIANPGLESIRAALQPSDSDALYCVLRPDGSGGHQFSSTIAAHETAVGQYSPWPSTGKSVKQQLREYLSTEQPAAITETGVARHADALRAGIRRSYLRDLLRATGLPFAQRSRESASTISKNSRNRCARCSRSMPWLSETADRARYARRQSDCG